VVRQCGAPSSSRWVLLLLLLLLLLPAILPELLPALALDLEALMLAAPSPLPPKQQTFQCTQQHRRLQAKVSTILHSVYELLPQGEHDPAQC
jgi:hypothetical protein